MTGPGPLSFAQQRLWFLDRLASGSSAWHIPAAVLLHGPLDVDALDRALVEILRRHAAWRTCFPVVNGKPVQHILPLPVSALHPRASDANTLDQDLIDEIERPFDLATGLPVRLSLFELGHEKAALCLVAHHIVADGWSLALFWRELAALYGAFRHGMASPLPDSPLAYSDLVQREVQHLTSDRLRDLTAWWRNYLGENPRGTALSPDFDVSASPDRRGARFTGAIPAALVTGLQALARQQRATSFMAVLAVLASVMARLTDQEQILTGTPVAQRGQPDSRNTLGLLLDTVIIKTDLSGNPGFSDLLAQVREASLDAFDHRDLPFQQLVQALRLDRSPATPPLNSLTLVFQNQTVAPPTELAENLVAIPVPVAPARVANDLTLYVDPRPEEWVLTWEYAADRFEAGTISRLHDHVGRLFAQLVKDPLRPVNALPLTSTPANHTAEPPAEPFTIAGRLLDLVARQPDAPALITEESTISYAGLAGRVSALTSRLDGIRPEQPVAVLMQRSAHRVAAQVAVMAAGGAYVPLDPDYPAVWLHGLLETTDPVAVITDSGSATNCEHWPVIDGTAGDWPSLEDSPIWRGTRLPGAAVAYHLFTSGSTGRPKAVMGTYEGIANRFAWMWRNYPFVSGEVAFHHVSPSFVDSVWDLFGPLLAGVPVVIPPPGIARDPARFLALCRASCVSRLTLVPSLLDALLDTLERTGLSLPSLRLCITSGEPLPRPLAHRMRHLLPHVVLLNLYGSAEIAADVTCRVVAATDDMAPAVPSGMPIAGTGIVLLNRDGQPTPLGAWGEVHVAGANLARGYLRQPAQTAERFLPYPGGAPGQRIFRTGDLGRWRSDGALELAGRLDHQIKIRGIRVEPGRLEEALRQCPGIVDAVVFARADVPGGFGLAAYVTGNSSLNLADLRNALAERLPPELLPASVVRLDALPRLGNGKVNRQHLPPPQATLPLVRPAGAAATATEQEVASLWAEVLGVDRAMLDPDTNVFDLGGHSLLMVRVHDLLCRRLALNIDIVDLFRFPTIRGLADHLDRHGHAVSVPVADTAESGYAARRRPADLRRAARITARGEG
ncbi:putative Phenylalanine racemase (ATP-hydrolyzing) [Paraburkholderia ribeironis]|uniref:Putative Phenylalanine racemase (ATP-hydrolyzing) n=1 Tax=Paraburkholderia ribeironis TaxID=1247936 RepID=A0A1N7RUN4_9BURK|nr:non-ribosomal peptide synthetase [Paraburkholderia ribeironis]SIT38828.1 putative Phenylalanine racemase (ATP-hydrolyzing) [Paraburkholderia ribeironis]